MKKELPKEMKELLKEVPDGQVGMPFLTPTINDIFKEEKLGENLYKVEFEGDFVVAEVFKKSDGSVSVSFKDSNLTTEYKMAKLNGYVMYKIATRE